MMKKEKKIRSVQEIIDEQVKKWEMLRAERPEIGEGVQVIALSREPGSGGLIVAQGLAERFAFDLFDREIVQKMAESADMSTRVLETLDEVALNALEDWVTDLVNQRHLWPDEYLKHLMNVVGTIGGHGRAVIVGRAASFILPPEKRFAVRVVAPLDVRVKNVADKYGASLDEAKRRVLRTESDRRAFTRKYFHTDIGDPINYDLVINTGAVDIEGAVEAIAAAVPWKKAPA